MARRVRFVVRCLHGASVQIGFDLAARGASRPLCQRQYRIGKSSKPSVACPRISRGAPGCGHTDNTGSQGQWAYAKHGAQYHHGPGADAQARRNSRRATWGQPTIVPAPTDRAQLARFVSSIVTVRGHGYNLAGGHSGRREKTAARAGRGRHALSPSRRKAGIEANSPNVRLERFHGRISASKMLHRLKMHFAAPFCL